MIHHLSKLLLNIFQFLYFTFLCTKKKNTQPTHTLAF